MAKSRAQKKSQVAEGPSLLGWLVPRKVLFFSALFHVAKKGRGIQAIHPKKLFFALFHVDVPGVFGAKVIRRIHTIIPKESFLFHVKVSVVNCAVRPLCLSA